MAFVKPTINKIEADIKNAYIYLRAVRKWGKTTTFKNIILQKYNGDASRGLLIEVGNEHGTTMLDNINVTHVSSYKDMVQLRDWLINEKGKEHNIEILCFDVVDELQDIFDREIIRLNNIENPNKPSKSIKSCFGGYNAGPEMSASKIKEYMESLKNAGFGIICLGHTKMKAVSDRASTEDERWMTLTGTLPSNYNAAIADVCDIVLTGNIEREFETKGDGENAKNYLVSEERRLYFRGTELIDAGSRFAPGTVPDYIVFGGTPEDFAANLIKTIEDGMENSKSTPTTKKTTTKKTAKKSEPVVEEGPDEEDMELLAALKETLAKGEDSAADDDVPFDTDDVDIFNEEEETADEDVIITLDDDRLNAIRSAFKASDASIKAKVKTHLVNYNNKLSAEMKTSDVNAIEEILGLNDEV
jgi:hypothetical protein